MTHEGRKRNDTAGNGTVQTGRRARSPSRPARRAPAAAPRSPRSPTSRASRPAAMTSAPRSACRRCTAGSKQLIKFGSRTLICKNVLNAFKMLSSSKHTDFKRLHLRTSPLLHLRTSPRNTKIEISVPPTSRGNNSSKSVHRMSESFRSSMWFFNVSFEIALIFASKKGEATSPEIRCKKKDDVETCLWISVDFVP